MDFTLRCNELKCRTQLNDRAVVTTCSHIFCLPCSEVLGLSVSAVDHRVCPACDTRLSNPDDAVVTQLNPTEDYKTSVLSGLNPSLIMECASRGLAFFQYQTAQEITYQDCMAKSLTERYSLLSSQMDNVINDANAEIMSLRDKLSGLHNEKKSLEAKNQELANAFREKSKAQQRLQSVYQKLKSSQNAQHIQHAAAHDAENVIHSINDTQSVHDVYGGIAQQMPQQMHAKGPNLQHIYSHARVGSAGSGGSGKRYGNVYQNGIRSVSGSGGATPSQHASHPPTAMYAGRNSTYIYPDNSTGIGSVSQHPTPNRQPLAPVDQNVLHGQGTNGYGLTGGAKVGRTGPFTRPPHGRVGSHILHR